jgi:hypothetical protein
MEIENSQVVKKVTKTTGNQPSKQSNLNSNSLPSSSSSSLSSSNQLDFFKEEVPDLLGAPPPPTRGPDKLKL